MATHSLCTTVTQQISIDALTQKARITRTAVQLPSNHTVARSHDHSCQVALIESPKSLSSQLFKCFFVAVDCGRYVDLVISEHTIDYVPFEMWLHFDFIFQDRWSSFGCDLQQDRCSRKGTCDQRQQEGTGVGEYGVDCLPISWKFSVFLDWYFRFNAIRSIDDFLEIFHHPTPIKNQQQLHPLHYRILNSKFSNDGVSSRRQLP